MSYSFFSLATAVRALMAQQQAVNVTAHNIANANTPGFSRQEVHLQATDPYPIPCQNNLRAAGQVGTGVEVASIRRARDRFLDFQYRNEQQTLGYWQAVSSGLGQVEVIFNEPSDNGLASQLNSFWNVWRDLANAPQSTAVRMVVREQAGNLATLLRDNYAQILQLQRDVDERINLTAPAINSLAQRISALNTQIEKVIAVGDQPNDLRDQRDLLLDELSKLVEVYYFENQAGTMVVNVGGQPLVAQGTVNEIGTAVSAGGVWELRWPDGSPVSVLGGELRGLMDLRDRLLPGMLGELDDLAATLISAVNAQHQLGFGLNGSTGLDFFQGTGAQDIDVAAAIRADVASIGAAANDGARGESENALAISDLQYALLMQGGVTTLGDFYRGMVSALGVQRQQASAETENQELLVRHIGEGREAVSGVSIDEETANLIKFQRAYEAASRVVTVVDDMLDTIINRMGLVGR